MISRRPTSIDIAAEAGVSQSTVSRVLNRSALVSDEVRQKVLSAAARLNYKVDTNARRLRSSKVYSIALLILEDMQSDHSAVNPFFLPMIGAIVKRAAELHYEVLISLQYDENDWGASYCLSRPAEGIIFLGSKDFDTYAENFRSHNHSDDNWVVWGLNETKTDKSCVVCDNRGGAVSAVRHLIEGGRRRIAFIGRVHSTHWEFAERLQGYHDGLAEAGLAVDPALVIDCELTLEDGAAAAQKLIASGATFDAIFASTDTLGVGAMRELLARGYAIPGDVALVGFDDMWICNIVWPRLTSVRQNTQLAGQILVDRVCALIEGEAPSHTRLPTELIVRESSSA